MFTQACHINLSGWSWLENLNNIKLSVKLAREPKQWYVDCEAVCLFLLLQSVVVAKIWIECEYNAKALNLSMILSRKHEVVAKAWIKHKEVAKAYML